MITFYFATRNRLEMLEKCLNNLQQFSPNSQVFIANCSSVGEQFEKTSQMISGFANVREFQYFVDPGMAVAYNDLFYKIETPFSVVWGDDCFLLKSLEPLLQFFNDDPMVNLVGLPLLDDISAAPSIKASWPKDHYGCNVWQTPTGRCAQQSIVRNSYFQRFPFVFTAEVMIDNFFHEKTLPQMRKWPEPPEPYVLHTRIDDPTRADSLMERIGNKFRFPVGHSMRQGSLIQTVDERDEVKCSK